MSSLRSKPTEQKGAALIVSLVFLVVLALIGISSMDTARFEYSMGQNTQFQLDALANAEMVLRIAEQDLEAIVTDSDTLNFETTDDHYYFPVHFEAPDTALRNWNFSKAQVTDGNYVIEYWGQRALPGESLDIGSSVSGSYVHMFEVSAQSQSGKGAQRNVQSIFVSRDAP